MSVRDLIEQEARNPVHEPHPEGFADAQAKLYESEIEASKAISLKRIADLLDFFAAEIREQQKADRS